MTDRADYQGELYLSSYVLWNMCKYSKKEIGDAICVKAKLPHNSRDAKIKK